MRPSRELSLVKVGGSLFDLPDLRERLHQWMHESPARRHVFIAGGGQSTNVVRSFADTHRIGDDRAHWLAVRAMSLQAHLLASLLPGSCVTCSIDGVASYDRHDTIVFDAADAMLSGRCPLPVGWHVTSDSIAAAVAGLLGADLLILLKSVGGIEPISMHHAIRRGWLDSHFPAAVGATPVKWVNLREGHSCSLARD